MAFNPILKPKPLSVPSESELDRRSFRIDAAAIEKLGVSQLDRRQKKLYDARRVMSLGGHAPKNIKTPINILKGIRHKQKERQDRQDALNRAGGNLVKNHEPRSNAVKPSKNGDGLRIGIGHFSDGNLKISKRAIATVERKSGEPISLSNILRR